MCYYMQLNRLELTKKWLTSRFMVDLSGMNRSGPGVFGVLPPNLLPDAVNFDDERLFGVMGLDLVGVVVGVLLLEFWDEDEVGIDSDIFDGKTSSTVQFKWRDALSDLLMILDEDASRFFRCHRARGPLVNGAFILKLRIC